MIPGALIIAVSFAYLGLLFAIAHWADRRADSGRSVIGHPTIYALSLAVYCTAWTFYGGVGRAAENGIGFLPIYLGPTLIALLWGSILLKMVRVAKSARLTSIADFIASRYGKSQLLGGLATVIAVVGVVPYIALQLKAIAWSFEILRRYPEVRMPEPTALPLWHDSAFIIALLLPSFAKSGWLPPSFMESGPGGLDWLAPLALFGLTGWNAITHGLFWSLTANVGAFLLVSSWRAPNAIEAAQARLFVDALRYPRRAGTVLWRGRADIRELMALAERFLGVARTRDAFARYAQSRGADSPETLPADAETVGFAETLLSGAIGSASARLMVASVTQEEPLGLDEVLDILDEASQIRAYSHQLEQKSRALEAATAELRAANERLQELDRLKDDFMSSVTHELRTPLASIRAFSEILYAGVEA